jgi:cell division protein FtsL
MSYKNTNVQKEYQRNWYQRKKLDNDWHQKAIEQSRQYKAKRKERLLNMNDNITAEVTVAVVPQNNESWYQHICAEIRLGHELPNR